MNKKIKILYTVSRFYRKIVIRINQLLEGNYGRGHRAPQILFKPDVLAHY